MTMTSAEIAKARMDSFLSQHQQDGIWTQTVKVHTGFIFDEASLRWPSEAEGRKVFIIYYSEANTEDLVNVNHDDAQNVLIKFEKFKRKKTGWKKVNIWPKEQFVWFENNLTENK